jgi:serine/threonine-protein kinase HipA
MDGADATLENAMSMCALFALKKDEAVRELRGVCQVVSGWRAHFAGAGVSGRDIELLGEQIDRPFLRQQRDGF